MRQHTPEPWEVEEYKGDYPWLIVGKNGEDITPTLKESDAKRICLCVNALAGIPDEILEELTQKNVCSEDIAEIVKFKNDLAVINLQKQNAELVEALSYLSNNYMDTKAQENAREVLAKVKGE